MHGDFDYEKTESWASGYINPGRRGDFHSLQLGRLLKKLEGVNGKVLEIGCGAGRVIRSLKRLRPDLEAYGCDISFAALQKARAYPEAVDYQRADACELPYQGETFAAILAWDVIEHTISPEQAIKELHRVLKCGGIVSAVVPCEGNTFTLHNVLKRVWLGQLRYKLRGHIQRFTTDRVLAIFRSVGFTLRDVRYSWHWVGQVADVWRDVLVGRMKVPLECVVGKKSWKVLLRPELATFAILVKIAYCESTLLKSFGSTALSVELTLEKENGSAHR